MDPDDLARHWANRVGTLKTGHYRAATRFERRHLWAGGLLIAVTALAAGLTQLRVPELLAWPYWPVAQTAVGLVAIVLAGIQTFVRWAEKAEKHRAAGATYAKLELQLDELLAFPQESMKTVVSELYDEWARLTGGSPALPQDLYQKFCACLDRDPCGANKGQAAALDAGIPPPMNRVPVVKQMEFPVFLSTDRHAVFKVPVDLSLAEAERATAILKAVVVPTPAVVP